MLKKTNNVVSASASAAARVWTPWVVIGYVVVVLIWGTSWFGIHTQLNGTTPQVSVGLRIALASLIFFVVAAARGERLRLPKETLTAIVIPGICFFGLNYLAVYEGSQYLTSGIVAVVFAAAVPFNILTEWALAGVRPRVSIWIAAVVGMLGIALVFSAELDSALRLENALFGAALVVFAAGVVSIGNVLSARLVAGRLRPVVLNAYGMAIGASTILLWGFLSETEWTLELTLSWAVGLGYLTLFGSVAAFWIYMALLPRIGPVSAAYSVVLAPVVALCISTALEELRLRFSAFIGIGLLMAGNALLIHAREKR